MTTPHLNQIITLRDGRRASVYRIQLLWPTHGDYANQWYRVSVVTVTGECSEIYL